MHAYLSPDSPSGWMLTAFRPVLAVVKGTNRMANYARPGDPLIVRHLCDDGIVSLFGALPTTTKPTRVEMSGRLLTAST